MTVSVSSSESSLDQALGSPVPRAPARSRRSSWFAALGIGSLALLFGLGYVPRRTQRDALVREAARVALEPRVVSVVTPLLAKTDRPLLLPGSIQASERAKVYSRANGYVRAWSADMGDPVSAGQLLAELDTPEVDREIDQARASLARAEAVIVQAAATLEFATSTSMRYASLAQEGLISRQELDERLAQANVDTATVRVAEAERNARRADLRRLEQLQSFARVVSPFAGTVSARNVERGTLVNAGAANPLFEVVALDPVRVFLQVPQSLVQSIKPGLAVEIRLNEYPNESFPGELTRSSGTLDPDSRTMNVEVRAPNPDRKLLPGMYASVRVGLQSSRRLHIVPATAIMNQSTGSFVAVVDRESKVRLRPVAIERDSGAEVELGNGLEGNEQVIGAPGPDIVEGLSVRIAG